MIREAKLVYRENGDLMLTKEFRWEFKWKWTLKYVIL